MENIEDAICYYPEYCKLLGGNEFSDITAFLNQHQSYLRVQNGCSGVQSK